MTRNLSIFASLWENLIKYERSPPPTWSEQLIDVIYVGVWPIALICVLAIPAVATADDDWQRQLDHWDRQSLQRQSDNNADSRHQNAEWAADRRHSELMKKLSQPPPLNLLEQAELRRQQAEERRKQAEEQRKLDERRYKWCVARIKQLENLRTQKGGLNHYDRREMWRIYKWMAANNPQKGGPGTRDYGRKMAANKKAARKVWRKKQAIKRAAKRAGKK